MIDIKESHLIFIQDALKKYLPKCEVRAFGSRVNGNAKSYSDLDLVIMGDDALDKKILYELQEEFVESDLPFRVDLLEWATISNEFKKIIEAKFVVIQYQNAI